MKQFNHITLVHKHLRGDLSTEEKKAYDSWLESSSNEQLVEDLGRVWDLSADYQPTSFQPNATAAFNKFKDQIRAESKQESSVTEIPIITKESKARVIKMSPMKWASRIAASLLFVAACFYLIGDRSGTTTYDKEIFAQTLESTFLEDGSTVWLDNGSTLAVANDFGSSDRKLKLEGKAFFDVERNEEQPFRVEMGGNLLEVLGTSFNIDNSSDDVIVEVKTGLVKITSKTKTVELKAGQKAVINYSSDKITVGETNENSFNWYNDKLVIKNMAIGKAMDKIADFYKVDIKLSANVDKSCMLTSPLATSSSLENLFEVLAVTHKMQYEKLGSNNYQIKFLDCK